MPPTFDIGETVGDYRIVGILGAGGSGEVFKAEHTITRRAEAIKILALGRPHSPEEQQRFVREIQVQASLDHPNVASVHTAFWTASGLVLAMELVEGESLESILERGRVPLGTAIGYMLQTLSALIHAHAHGVIHRDIKPGNIVVAPNGTVKLTDFGLAREAASPRVTSTGALAGSPYYMSPEQIDGGELDARTDVYSLGVVLYELVTGVKPFVGESAFSIMLAHRDSPPVPPIALDPSLGQALNDLILTALAKHPGERFQTAADFRYALDAARQALHLSPATATSSYSRGDVRRSRLGLLHSQKLRWAGVVVAAALGVVLGVESASLLQGRREVRPPVSHVPAPPPAPAITPAPPLVAPTPAVSEANPEQIADTPAKPAEEPPARAIPKKVQRRKAPRIKDAEAPVVIIGHPPQPQQAESPAVPERVHQPASAAPVQEAAGDPAPPPETAVPASEATADKPATAGPQKRGNRVWRALGKIVRPFKPSGAAKPQPEQPASK